VLPIGGLREKVLAAERYGLKRIVIPHDNEPDLEELPEETREELEFVLADTIQDVFEVAFSEPGRSVPQAAPASERQAAASV
jgi:ATP-dependent Lon protease